jgi:[ribosomal protein S18]-alanine N-acetyltransferase
MINLPAQKIKLIFLRSTKFEFMKNFSFQIILPGESSSYFSKIIHLELACFKEQKWSDAGVQSHLQNYPLLISVSDSVVTGYVLFLEGLWDLEILRIGTDPDYRKQGIGANLLQVLINREKPILLEVKANNLAAIHLYEKMNFKQIGNRKKYYPDGMDGLIYYLEAPQSILPLK